MYKTLFVNGCSMSYYKLLPKEVQWPHLLGKELGVSQVINYGEGCGSNPRILRTTFDFIQQSQELADTIAIIQTTNPFRFEFPFKNSWVQCNNMHCATKDLNALEYGTKLIESKIERYTSEVDFNEYFQQIMSLECLLKSSGIKKYFFINYSSIEDYKDINSRKLDFLDRTITWASSSGFRSSSIFNSKYNEISSQDPHPSPIGHHQIKDWILNLIQDKV